MTQRRLWIAGGLYAAAIAGCANGAAPALTQADSTAIAQVQAAYVRAWLADDTSGVLATLDSGAVLLPPGRSPVEGLAAIRAFWWPNDGSSTRITRFDWQAAEVLGSGNMAVARGMSTLSWVYVKDTVRREQTGRNLTLSVLRRGPDGTWRIARQMWGAALR